MRWLPLRWRKKPLPMFILGSRPRSTRLAAQMARPYWCRHGLRRHRCSSICRTMAAIQIWSSRYRTRVSKLLALIRIPPEQTSGINGITKRVGSGQLFASELGNQCPPVRHSRTQPANLHVVRCADACPSQACHHEGGIEAIATRAGCRKRWWTISPTVGLFDH
jgi:hypothetical protein